jgi:hypothetical protein
MRRLLLRSIILAAVVAAAAQPVAAAKPLLERIPIDDQFTDPFFSTECGFDVTFTGTGFIVVHTWLGPDGELERQVVNYGIRSSFSANGNTLRAVDTGVDTFTVYPDGSMLLHVVGSLALLTAPGTGPVAGSAGLFAILFTPLLDEDGNPVLDPDGNPIFTEEVVVDAGIRPEFDLAAICAALASGA